MKAITFTQHALPIDNPQALIDISLPVPTPDPRDLLVEVRAFGGGQVPVDHRSGWRRRFDAGATGPTVDPPSVIGTASRQETADWVRQLGAHHMIDHSQPLLAQLQALGVPDIDYVASLTHTEQHVAQLIDVLKPQGRLGVIDDPESLDVMPLKRKSVSLHWGLMFGAINAANMRRAHALIESGKARGKIVLEGF